MGLKELILASMVTGCAALRTEPTEKERFERAYNVHLYGAQQHVDSALPMLKALFIEEYDIKTTGLQAIYLVGADERTGPEACSITSGSGWQGLRCGGTIVLKAPYTKATALHELIHIEYPGLLKQQPDFERRWLSLTVDDTGESLYFTREEKEFLDRNQLANIDTNKTNFSSNSHAGFINTHARANVREDVAYTREEAIMSPAVFFLPLFEHPSTRMRGKIELLIQAGELPVEFPLMVQLEYYQELMQDQQIEASARTGYKEQYVALATRFLQQFPNTSYSTHVKEKISKF
jgi:hypothetical protein